MKVERIGASWMPLTDSNAPLALYTRSAKRLSVSLLVAKLACR
jgi:hypothetical protein